MGTKEIEVGQLVALEDELHMLKKEYGIEEKTSPIKKVIDRIVEKVSSREPVSVKKVNYCICALMLGVFGVHQFMVHKWVKGIVYLALSFTGLSFVLSLLDILYAAFLKTDDGTITI